MKIGPVDSGDRPQRPEKDEGHRHDIQPELRRRNDSVEISDSARTLAEQPASQESRETGALDSVESPDEDTDVEIRSDRVERARRRAESGYYDRPEIREEIARRITDDFAG